DSPYELTENRYESTGVEVGQRWVFTFDAAAFSNVGGVFVHLLCLLLAWAIRRLPEYISPSGRRADVDIAEPQRVVEGMSVVAAFFPKPCGHCSGVAPNAHSLHGVFLMLIDRSPTTRVVEEVCLGVRL